MKQRQADTSKRQGAPPKSMAREMNDSCALFHRKSDLLAQALRSTCGSRLLCVGQKLVEYDQQFSLSVLVLLIVQTVELHGSISSASLIKSVLVTDVRPDLKCLFVKFRERGGVLVNEISRDSVFSFLSQQFDEALVSPTFETRLPSDSQAVTSQPPDGSPSGSPEDNSQGSDVHWCVWVLTAVPSLCLGFFAHSHGRRRGHASFDRSKFVPQDGHV